HEILFEYVRKWGFIISTGLRKSFYDSQQRGHLFRPRFVYIDYFSFTGIYAPENGEPVYGSPIIGIRALDEIRQFGKEKVGFDCDIIAILIEEDKATYNQLLDTLHNLGYSDRLRTDPNFGDLK